MADNKTTMSLTISNQYPPIWEEANKIFKIEELGVYPVFTYGNVLYNPFCVILTPDLLRHEETHMEQQEGHPDVAAMWWKRYLQDEYFRIDVETEAYGEQYIFFCRIMKDWNRRTKALWWMGGQLSGPLYGSCLEPSEARYRIKEYVKMNCPYFVK